MFRGRIITLVLVASAVTLASSNTSEAGARVFARQRQAEERGSAGQGDSARRGQSRLFRQIRRELVTLPYYDVFDWLEAEARPDGTVILRGQVVRPSTKSDAEERVEDIEGVTRVVNEIEVLPPSPSDDRLRLALYRAVLGPNSPLFRYSIPAVPSIHLVVNRGRATLKGVVATEGDRRIAYARARGVPGLFAVESELTVENERRAR